RSLGIEVGIGVLAEHGGLRSRHRRLEQAVIAHRVVLAKSPLGHVKQLRERQVDHCPSRSRASAYLGSSSSSTWLSNSERLWFSMYSLMAHLRLPVRRTTGQLSERSC